MDKTEVKQRIEKLKKIIRHHRYLYHVLDRQEISEAALDSLKKELFDLEQKYPQFITFDSPTQRIGGQPLKEFKKIRHQEMMLSFNDAFSEKDINDWQDRVSKLLTEKEKSEIDFFCELKIDGLAIELIYENGVLNTGSTRGNGIIGENITQNLKTIEAIPFKLRKVEGVVNEFMKKVVVRGEVFITKKEFDKINQAQIKKGLTPYANPRNIAAGSIRQLNPKVTASRNLDSYIYDLITDFGQTTHEEKHRVLQTLGFKTNKNNKYCKNLKEVFQFQKFWQKRRDKLPYEIDGVVVIINQNRIFEKLGVVGKAPRAAIAFKFPLKEATTKITDIKVQIGRTGALTPVAHLKPVKVGGVTITRATLHNEDEIKKLGVKIGDTVIIGRAGDVIPDIIKVLSGLRTKEETEFKMPKQCPVCGTKLVKPLREVLWRCPNMKCFARRKRYFHHFISKGAFDVSGLGPQIINRLLKEGLVQDPSDLFELREGDLVLLERFAEKSAENLIKAISEKKEITLPRFIYALGIRNVGEETAIDLSNHFGSIERLRQASRAELESILDIGPIVSKSIYDWFNNKDNLRFLEKSGQVGIKIITPKKPTPSNFTGLSFVLTGTLETMSREKARETIRQRGGQVSESISQNTSYVIVGEDPGSKLRKAKEIGVTILNEKDFLNLIKKN